MEQLRSVLQKYWGYDGFRPLQAEAMQSVLDGRDSVVVLPTGGGKSLCFQAPAVCMPGLAIVVSPLISLMKDQVDALNECGVAAACVNSSHSSEERAQVAKEIREERLKLLYVAPERLNTPRMIDFLRDLRLSFIAVDEAHCISSWGHDFRPEYRALRDLKTIFPGIAVHAYTATATEHVRNDMIAELGLSEPEVLVGSFDRPNLVYRVLQRTDRMRQIREVLERHSGESGVIYCMRRADVEDVCASLASSGFRALPYHAGMEDADRKRNQEAFIQERADIIVATVAFGMGIDKSNVRFVIHAGAPKSLESYQQESGRAGRDGLEAECCLFHSAGDFITWKKLQEDLEPAAREIASATLGAMQSFCTGATCRHKSLVEYFGQTYETDNCGACDVCLQEVDLVDEPLIIGQKILSCVVRLRQNFGSDYTAQVLTGSREQRIVERQHDKLSTWGLLSDQNKQHVRHWIEQLVGQGYLQKAGEYNVLQVTPSGRRLLKGEVTPRLLKPASAKRKKESKVAVHSWEGVDRELFEELRSLRRRLADARSIPTWMIFSDKSLRDMARLKPTTRDGFLDVHGVGEKKCAEFGPEFLAAIAAHLGEEPAAKAISAATTAPVRPTEPRVGGAGRQDTKTQAFELFEQGQGIEEVAEAIGRARSTTAEYLAEYIVREQITDASHWLDGATLGKIEAAARESGLDKLKPIYERLEGTATYDQIRIGLACLRNAVAEGSL